jgi:hypothetical protein
MYRVFLERAAEKDLGRLSAGLHDRVIDVVLLAAELSPQCGTPESSNAIAVRNK